MNVEASWDNHVYCLRPNGVAVSSCLSYFVCFFFCRMCLIWGSQVQHILTFLSMSVFILLLITLLLSKPLIHYFFSLVLMYKWHNIFKLRLSGPCILFLQSSFLSQVLRLPFPKSTIALRVHSGSNSLTPVRIPKLAFCCCPNFCLLL